MLLQQSGEGQGRRVQLTDCKLHVVRALKLDLGGRHGVNSEVGVDDW